MLALASFALSLPAQQQQQAIVPENSTAIAPDNSTAPLPELNLLTHFRAWTCGERMYRLAPNSTTHGGCPKFSVPILEKLECDKAVCSAMAPGKEMNPYNVDNKEGAGAGKYHVRAARPLAAPLGPADPPPPLPRQSRTQRKNHDKWPAGCYRAADPADLEDALDGADAPMVKFNDPASGASTAATGNDYELICEIKVAPASSPSP